MTLSIVDDTVPCIAVCTTKLQNHVCICCEVTSVICCIFTKSSSNLTAIFYSDLSPQEFYILWFIKLCLFFLLVFYCPPIFPIISILFIIQLPPVSSWSFFIFCVPFHHSLFLACECSLHVILLCLATSSLSLSLLFMIILCPFYSYSPLLWLLHICPTLYIISWSPVMVF